MAGPYLGGAEDIVTLLRAWLNVVAPDFVFSTLDPALNRAMDGLEKVKLSPALTESPNPLPANEPGPGQTINAAYTVITAHTPR
jgi:hypothetical protein